jgi:hypothetical protein
MHIDHQYVAVADSPSPVSAPAHPFAWFAADELADLSRFDDTRMLVEVLFLRIAGLVAASASGPVDVLALTLD